MATHLWLKARVGIGLEVMRLELKMIILPESNRTVIYPNMYDFFFYSEFRSDLNNTRSEKVRFSKDKSFKITFVIYPLTVSNRLESLPITPPFSCSLLQSLTSSRHVTTPAVSWFILCSMWSCSLHFFFVSLAFSVCTLFLSPFLLRDKPKWLLYQSDFFLEYFFISKYYYFKFFYIQLG